MRSHLLLIPALLLSGCTVEVGGDEAEGRATASLHTLTVPFFSQQPNGKACTAAVLAMSLGSFGVSTLEDGNRSATGTQPIYKWFAAKGYLDKVSGYLDTNKVFEATETLSGNTMKADAVWWKEASVQSVKDAIDAGSPAIVFAQHNLLPGSEITTPEHHAILAYGYSEDVIYYYNPWRSTVDRARFSISSADLVAALLQRVIIRFSSSRGPLFGWSYCSVEHPCAAGQGDCDSDRECQPGLVCAQDVGARYGANSIVDVCELPPGAAPSWDCSKSSHHGTQIWTCSGSSRYRCDASGTPMVEHCPSGCVVKPSGTDDICG